MDKNDVFQYPGVEIQKLNGEVKSIDCPARDAETWAPLALFPPPKQGPQIVKPFSPELLGQQTQMQNVTKNITKFSISSDVDMVLLHGKGDSSKSERPR